MSWLSLVGLLVFFGLRSASHRHGPKKAGFNKMFSQDELDRAFRLANTRMQKERETRKMFKELGIDQDFKKSRGPSHFHFGLLRHGDKYAERSGQNYGRLFELALQELVKKRKYDPQRARQFVSQLLQNPNVIPYNIHLACLKSNTSGYPNFSPYRTADGSYNNLKRPKAGKAGMPFSRFLAPEYGDGLGSPKIKGRGGRRLNSARFISRVVHTADSEETEAKGITLMVMQWGQFLDHDITRTPIQAGLEMSEIKCCKSKVKIKKGKLKRFRKTKKDIEKMLYERDGCFPIWIPKGDPHFSESCMNFVRSLPAAPTNCKFGFREQQNDITAFVDASNVYGSSDEETRGLRKLQDGLMLQSDVIPRQKYLPQDENDDLCVKNTPSQHCFEAGDSRVNEIIGLTSMHTLWVREHNRIANELKKLHRGWNDEKLFQETRRIVGALMQKITYEDWLPVILGPKAMKEYGIEVQGSLRHFRGYSDSVDATIKNAFATAAFRVGHTFINQFFKRTSRSWSTRGFPSLRTGDHFFNPGAFYDQAREGADSILRGLVVARSQKFDRHLTTEVTERLFETIVDGKKVSMDLAALNIQRGRDHGLPGYMEFRQWCGLKTTNKFDSLPDHDHASKKALQKAYKKVEDIELFVGGISEMQIRESMVGPTFKCLIGKQFRNLKLGDRFYFENQPRGSVQGFTLSELCEIRKVSLSRIYCNNVDVSTIQPNAFREVDQKRNRRIPCSKIPRANLEVFDSSLSRLPDTGSHGNNCSIPWNY